MKRKDPPALPPDSPKAKAHFHAFRHEVEEEGKGLAEARLINRAQKVNPYKKKCPPLPIRTD